MSLAQHITKGSVHPSDISHRSGSLRSPSYHGYGHGGKGQLLVLGQRHDRRRPSLRPSYLRSVGIVSSKHQDQALLISPRSQLQHSVSTALVRGIESSLGHPKDRNITMRMKRTPPIPPTAYRRLLPICRPTQQNHRQIPSPDDAHLPTKNFKSAAHANQPRLCILLYERMIYGYCTLCVWSENPSKD